MSNNAAAAGITIKPVIYTSSSFAGTWLNSTVTKWIPWIANWNGENPQTGGATISTSPWSTWVCWQYGSMSIPGYGTVDGDVFTGTSASLKTTLVIGGSPPVITNQPASQIVMWGTNVTFNVGVSGATPVSYQWRFNGTNISGATLSSYTRSNVQFSDSGSYSVTVTNTYGTTNSANAVLTVISPPIISAQPTNVYTGLGLSATFRVTAVGTTPLNYQWQFNGTDLPGATSSSLTIGGVAATNVGPYSVVVSNFYGTALSSNALLTMLDPFISSQPQNATVAAGAPATFSVGAVGTAPLHYSWRKNGAALADGGNISGSGTAVLDLASAQLGDVGTYSVVVSNANGWMVSSNATLVAAYAPTITTQPAVQRVPAGSAVSLGVAVLGPGPVTYRWRKDGTNVVDGTNITGSATTTLTLSNVQAGAMGNYSLSPRTLTEVRRVQMRSSRCGPWWAGAEMITSNQTSSVD